MAIGNVGLSGRARKEVAPNSPRDMVKEKMAPTRAARPMIGNSTSRQTFQDDAPSTEAALRSDAGMEASTGCTLRTTKGKATSVCAIGMSSGKCSGSKGGILKVTRKPSPSVTAEAPRGRVIRVFNQRACLALRVMA